MGDAWVDGEDLIIEDGWCERAVDGESDEPFSSVQTENRCIGLSRCKFTALIACQILQSHRSANYNHN